MSLYTNNNLIKKKLKVANKRKVMGKEKKERRNLEANVTEVLGTYF